MYTLPETSLKELKKKLRTVAQNPVVAGFGLLLGALIIAVWAGTWASLQYFPTQAQDFLQYIESKLPQAERSPQTAGTEYHSDITYEQAIIDAAKRVSPSVVSIVISKNVPVYEQDFVNPFGPNSPFDIQVPQYVERGSKLQEVGAGSGFIVSADGLVVTNKHVVSDPAASYTVFTNDQKKYQAKVMALDPVQDLAIIKIQSGDIFSAVEVGDSSGVQVGQTVIAIGNALGQFSNSVSVGIVSGLSRTISASDQLGGFSETLEGIIQTDAAINAGNSGGPLVNLKGQVIGINTAMAEGAQSIGFAIPSNRAKKDVQQVAQNSKITYPFLGIRYIAIDEEVQQQFHLSVDYGVMIYRGARGEVAVSQGSGADKAGLKEGDVVVELNGERVTAQSSLANMILQYNPGDTVTLKILRDGKEMEVKVVLGERQ